MHCLFDASWLLTALTISVTSLSVAGLPVQTPFSSFQAHSPRHFGFLIRTVCVSINVKEREIFATHLSHNHLKPEWI